MDESENVPRPHTLEHAYSIALSIPQERDNWRMLRELISDLQFLVKKEEQTS